MRASNVAGSISALRAAFEALDDFAAIERSPVLQAAPKAVVMPAVQPSAVSFLRDAKWQRQWLFAAGVFLALLQLLRLFDREWLSAFPAWIVLVLTGVAPQIFFLVFPLYTREEAGAAQVRLPSIKRCLIEFAIAIPFVFVSLVAASGAMYLAEQVTAAKPLLPTVVDDMASSPEPRLVHLVLLFSFTFAPVAEEVFFRGFIYNAFRSRMPKVVAGLAQSLVFGFAHFFGPVHAVIASGLGIVLTFVYEWRKTLITPVLVHCGINFIFAMAVFSAMTERANQPSIGVIGGREGTRCVVRKIVPGSAAAESQIRIGDLITAFDGQPVATFRELAAAVGSRRPGDTVKLTIERSGAAVEVDITLKRRGHPAPTR
jgi:membrane protease YdiL (CAAX protease family)